MERNVVVVYDCEDMDTSKIIEMLVNPRKVKTTHAHISVIGFADAAQVRQVIGVINGRYELPQ